VPVAVEGTRNVINAAADEGVRRAVFTSTYGAVHMDPNRSPDVVLDETCWSDYDFCKKTGVSCRHCQPLFFFFSDSSHHSSTIGAPEHIASSKTCAAQNVYCCAKMMAEVTANEEAARRGLQLAVVVPCISTGPMLQQAFNFSGNHVVDYLMGKKRSYPNAVAAYVDVRDVARAHVLAYERPQARGRYLCIGTVLHRAQFIAMLRELFPQYPVTAK
jgi:cinnamoyl-CoA reductase